MISSEFCRVMARYSQWQNTALMTAASGLTAEARLQDRGAFFGSIAATFQHLLVDDALWLARFDGDPRPEGHVADRREALGDWPAFGDARRRLDARILEWADGLGADDCGGTVTWFPGGGDTRVEKPRALCLVHFFNHQTHHRGQIHALLTAAGAETEPTDLPMLAMP